MTEQISISSDELVEAFDLRHCTVLKSGTRSEEIGNSVILFSRWFPFARAAAKAFPHNSYEEINIGLNFVTIEGPRPNEPLHVHIAAIAGIVIEGSGVLIYEKSGSILREVVTTGDVIVMPPRSLHCFDAAVGEVAKYSFLEFGPQIDYQKHDPSEFSGGSERS